jgi:hypothetical protein
MTTRWPKRFVHAIIDESISLPSPTHESAGRQKLISPLDEAVKAKHGMLAGI